MKSNKSIFLRLLVGIDCMKKYKLIVILSFSDNYDNKTKSGAKRSSCYT